MFLQLVRKLSPCAVLSFGGMITLLPGSMEAKEVCKSDLWEDRILDMF